MWAVCFYNLTMRFLTCAVHAGVCVGDAVCLLCGCRLEGSHAAQAFAVQLIKLALKRGQFYLSAEILRFLIPPREGVVQWGPGSPVDGSATAARDAAAAAAAAMPGGPQKQLSGSAAAAAAGSSGQGGWFSWIWGSSGSQQQQQPDKGGKQGAAGEGLVSQPSLSAAGSMEHGSDACKIVADKAWRLLYTVREAHHSIHLFCTCETQRAWFCLCFCFGTGTPCHRACHHRSVSG